MKSEVEKRILNQIAYCETEAVENGLNSVEYNDKKIGVITAGICYEYAKEALGDKCPEEILTQLEEIEAKVVSQINNKESGMYELEDIL